MIRCFIIDDEKAVSGVIQYFVAQENIPIQVAEVVYDGKRGKEILDTDQPHLVFIDIQMPFFNGLELMERFPQHKYIVVTAFDFFQYAHKSLQLGAVDYLLKPIQKDKLLEAIQRALGYKLYRDEITDHIVQILQRDFAQRLTLQAIADRLGYHPAYIARHFKKITGLTIMEQLTKIRMNEAKRRLQNGEDTIQSIAEQCGYRSESGFYRDFKKEFSLTPSMMRSGQEIE